MSALMASPTALDKVQVLQRTLYRAAKADPGRRFHALFDKVLRRDVLERGWVQVRRNGALLVLIGPRLPWWRSTGFPGSCWATCSLGMAASCWVGMGWVVSCSSGMTPVCVGARRSRGVGVVASCGAGWVLWRERGSRRGLWRWRVARGLGLARVGRYRRLRLVRRRRACRLAACRSVSAGRPWGPVHAPRSWRPYGRLRCSLSLAGTSPEPS